MGESAADPLTRLVLNEAEVDRELLASALEGLIRLDLGQGAIAFQAGVRAGLSKRQIVLTALLARKALHLLAAEHAEALRPQAIEFLTGVKGNTLRPILKQLADGGLVRRDDSDGYFVPPYAVEQAAHQLLDRRAGQSARGAREASP